MIKQLVILSTCLTGLSLSLAHINCEDCTSMANKLGEVSTTEEAVAGALAVIMGPVCENAPADSMCEDKLPAFWKAIQTTLFTAEHWWNPEYLCADLCTPEAARSAVRDLHCDECEGRVNASMDFLGDEETTINVVAAYQDSIFCSGLFPDDVEECMTGLELVIPIAFDAIFAADRSWISDFCSNDMACM